MSIKKKKPRPKKCKNPDCDEKFTPYYTTVQEVCSTRCAIELGKIRKKKKDAKENKQAKMDLLSPDKYRAEYVQKIFNEIARLIDHEQPCIATGNYGKMAGGHYHSVGSNRTTALHLHNIHIQSFHSNGPKGGDNIKYREGLREIYGQEYLEYVESLKQIPPIKLSKDDLVVIKKKASKIRNRLKKNPIKLPPKARIRLRETVNRELGIYEPMKTIY